VQENYYSTIARWLKAIESAFSSEAAPVDEKSR
jgi:hypothetical protein